jgi:hypothetical protein
VIVKEWNIFDSFVGGVHWFQNFITLRNPYLKKENTRKSTKNYIFPKDRSHSPVLNETRWNLYTTLTNSRLIVPLILLRGSPSAFRVKARRMLNFQDENAWLQCTLNHWNLSSTCATLSPECQVTLETQAMTTQSQVFAGCHTYYTLWQE